MPLAGKDFSRRHKGTEGESYLELPWSLDLIGLRFSVQSISSSCFLHLSPCLSASVIHSPGCQFNKRDHLPKNCNRRRSNVALRSSRHG
jgi:hypothetical protein